MRRCVLPRPIPLSRCATGLGATLAAERMINAVVAVQAERNAVLIAALERF
jgi:hypothetical protein